MIFYIKPEQSSSITYKNLVIYEEFNPNLTLFKNILNSSN